MYGDDENRDSLQYITNYDTTDSDPLSLSPGGSPSSPTLSLGNMDDEINSQIFQELESSLNAINEELAEGSQISDSDGIISPSDSDNEGKTTSETKSSDSEEDSDSGMESDEMKKILEEVDVIFDSNIYLNSTDFDSLDQSTSNDEDSEEEKKKKEKECVLKIRKKRAQCIVFTFFVIFCVFCLFCTLLVSLLTFYMKMFGEEDIVDFWQFARATNYHLLKSRNIEFIDSHGHIFNVEYVPSDVIPEYLYGIRDRKNEDLWDQIKSSMSKLSEVLDDLDLPDWLKPDGFQFLEAATKSMETLLNEWFETIHKQMNRPQFGKYSEAAVITLPIDMDLAYRFTSRSVPYIDQFRETKRICDGYNRNIGKKGLALFGFALDPRKLERLLDNLPPGYNPPLNDTETQSYLDYLSEALGSGAVACKVYPSLGFLPTHPILMKEIWPKFEEVGIPVITHCSEQGIHVTGRTYSYLDPASPSGVTTKTFLSQVEKSFFSHPSSWEPVIRQFPRLKVNFAHFGGAKQVNEEEDEDEDEEEMEEYYQKRRKLKWDEGIINLMKIQPTNNVYTDVSYFWTKKQFRAAINRVFEHRVWGRLLFGTDYYLSQIEKKTRKILSRFFDEVNWGIGKAISYDNILDFLQPNDGAESFIENEIIVSRSGSSSISKSVSNFGIITNILTFYFFL